ncbi:MAG: mercuric reductase [Chloroflexi bacterium]|nr:mercuric reductase [Chloroflexota bacterium]
MNNKTYDAIVLGAGQGGGPLALAMANAGWRTAIVEREHVGGTCVNTGCTPTKALVASARIAHMARNSHSFGVHTGLVSVNFYEVRKRKNRIVQDFRESSRQKYENTANLDLIMAEGAFAVSNGSGHSVQLRHQNGREEVIRGERIIIDTGSRAAVPTIAGIDQVEVLDEESVMELEKLPEHLVILGAGYIGLEFAQAFQRMGSHVTLIEREEQVLSNEDADISEEITKILRAGDVKILLSSSVSRVEQVDKHIRIYVDCPEGNRVIEANHLLAAIGRTPNTSALRLDKVGVQTDERGYIQVDDHLRTNIPGIFAMGDVKGGPEFTHIAYDDYRVLCDNLLLSNDTSVSGRMVPYTVFTDPQLGRVGLSERQAQQRNIPYRIARLPMAHVARAIEVGETDGFLKALIGADDQILGCAILGAQGGEIMSVIQMAMMGKLPYTTLRDAILAHPTFAEALNNLFSTIQD